MAKRRGPTGPKETPKQALRILDEFERRTEIALGPLRESLQATLQGLAGKSFGSFETNRSIALRVQRLVDRLASKLECQRQGCGKPAKIACYPTPTGHGSFQFAHKGEKGFVCHCGAQRIPALKLASYPSKNVEPRSDSVAPKHKAPFILTDRIKTAEQVLAALEATERLIESGLSPVRADFQETLRTIAGRTFNTYKANCRVIARLRRIQKQLGMAFKCQGPGCTEPSKLQCIPIMCGWPWRIQFDHLGNGKKIHHGYWVELPPLELIRLPDVEDSAGKPDDTN